MKRFALHASLLVSGLLSVTASQAQDQGSSEPGFWLWTFLGRLHPLAVHFPVALILFAALLELITIRKQHSRLQPAVEISLAIGTATAIVAAVFGWFLSISGDYGGEMLSLHQWIGIATAVIGSISYVLMRKARNSEIRFRTSYRIFLFLSALGVSVTGHFGASLTHGEDYLSSALPGAPKGIDKQLDLSGVDFAKLSTDSTLSNDQQGMLQLQVKTIFAHSCYKCHGAEKVKGDLRLDNKEMIFRGGESGPLFVAGDPEESELYRRITLPKGHEDVMPQKGKLLGEREIATIRLWIRAGAPWPNEDKEKVFRTAALEPRNPPIPAAGSFENPIDAWVNSYFSKKKIRWTQRVDDRVFLRRIYLDIIGLLPTPEQQNEFLKDPRPDKRALAVKNLLNRQDDYAIHWISFWNDALRNDYTGTGYITDGRKAITDWLFKSLQQNKPYDQFVKELIDPDESSKGFVEGIKWRGVVNASQSTEIQAAQNVAQVFLGLNLKCASCHNSFINNWKLEDAYAFANIFSDSSLEINRCDKPTGKYTKAKMLWEQLGSIDNEAPRAEKQKQLASIMVKQENGRIYRTIVNRVWAKMMGRGIVEPVDLMDNEPWSQDLLDWMAYNFANEGHFDLKELIYKIATSETYQLPSVGYKEAALLNSNDYTFRGMVRRRMSAEQFADAISSIVSPMFSDSMVKYDPGASSSFLMPNNAPRAALVVNNVFLTSLGRPNRETVITTRDSEANLLQALELTNGNRLNKALQVGAAKWIRQYPERKDLIDKLYSRMLNRLPTEEESRAIMKFSGEAMTEQEVQDLMWSIILLPEFQLIY